MFHIGGGGDGNWNAGITFSRLCRHFSHGLPMVEQPPANREACGSASFHAGQHRFFSRYAGIFMKIHISCHNYTRIQIVIYSIIIVLLL